jgi:hypothetical protein
MSLNCGLVSPEIEFAFKTSTKILICSLREEKRSELEVLSFVATNLSPVPNAVWLYCCHVSSRLSVAVSL